MRETLTAKVELERAIKLEKTRFEPVRQSNWVGGVNGATDKEFWKVSGPGLIRACINSVEGPR